MQAKAYSDAEKLKLHREFAKATDRSRRMMPIVIGASTAALVIGFIAILVVPAGFQIAVGVGFALIVAAVLLLLRRIFPGIKCPGCKTDIERAWGPFCPECSTPGLRIVDRHYKAQCDSCKKVLLYSGKTGGGRRRTHKIRACTSCGVQFGGHYI